MGPQRPGTMIVGHADRDRTLHNLSTRNPTNRTTPSSTEFPHEFWFLYLHILLGHMATLPRALPRSFRDLHVCFRESKFKTAASASFRGVDFFYDFSRSASAVTRGASAKAFCRGRVEMCCLYLLVSKALWDHVFGCTGWRVCLEHISK